MVATGELAVLLAKTTAVGALYATPLLDMTLGTAAMISADCACNADFTDLG